jgi:hypothetical protein
MRGIFLPHYYPLSCFSVIIIAKVLKTGPAGPTGWSVNRTQIRSEW